MNTVNTGDRHLGYLKNCDVRQRTTNTGGNKATKGSATTGCLKLQGGVETIGKSRNDSRESQANVIGYIGPSTLGITSRNALTNSFLHLDFLLRVARELPEGVAGWDIFATRCAQL